MNNNYYPIDEILEPSHIASPHYASPMPANNGINTPAMMGPVASNGMDNLNYNFTNQTRYPIDFDFGFLDPECGDLNLNSEFVAEIGANSQPQQYQPPMAINSPMSDTKDSHEHSRPKSAHNVIEQRYRNKINDKFQVLQNSVPTLRVAARRKNRKCKSIGSNDSDISDELSDEDLIHEDLQGLEPARKLNKGTILTKSIEYIKFLELKNDRIKYEQQQLIMKAKMLGISVDDMKFSN